MASWWEGGHGAIILQRQPPGVSSMCVIARYPQWVPIAVCGAVYCAAFWLPATLTKAGDESLSGFSAYRFAWAFRDERWLANPATWLAALLLAWRMWAWAALFALVGFGIAVSSAVRVGLGEWNDTHGSGYWLWTGSMALLFVASLAGYCGFVPRERRRSPVEVFHGWRGVALGSWIGLGLGVLANDWFSEEIYLPAAGMRPGDRVNASRFSAGGVSFVFEHRLGFAYSVATGDKWLTAQIGAHAIDFRDGELTLDGIDYGGLK